jgi:hypothetical protein
LRSIGSSAWGTPFRSGVQNGRPEKPRSQLRDGSQSGEIALRGAIEGAVYGWEGAAPQPRSRERLAETRGEERSAVLCRQRMRVLTPIPTRSTRHRKRIPRTIRHKTALVQEFRREVRVTQTNSSSPSVVILRGFPITRFPPRVYCSAPHPHARDDRSAFQWPARGRSQSVTRTSITVATRSARCAIDRRHGVGRTESSS